MADIATLGIAVESRQVATANDNLRRFQGAAAQAERSAEGYSRSVQKASNDNARFTGSIGAVYGRLGALSGALGGIAVLLTAGSLARYADQWSDLSARVGLAVGSMDLAPQVMARLGTIADNTYSSLNLTAESFVRNAASLRELGMSTNDQLTYLSALNDALVVSGARGDRARQVQDALSKSMALGKLSGDELNSVLFNGGAIAAALAEELGVNQNALRGLAAEGLITSAVIRDALINRVDELREKSAEMPATLEDAMGRVQNAILRTVGSFDQATGASGRLAEAIIWAVDNFDIFARGAAVAGAALLVAFGPAILSAIAFGFGYMGAAGVAAITAIGVAVAANPIGALVVAFTAAITAAYLFRDEIKKAVGIDVVEIALGAGNEIIGAFVGAYEGIKVAWAALPGALGDVTYSTANAVIKGVEGMINSVIGLINGYLDNVRSSLASLPFGLGENISIGKIEPVAFAGITNPHAGEGREAISGINEAVQNARGKDYLGGLRSSIGGDSSPDTAAVEELNRQLSEVPANAGAAGAAMDEAGKKGGSAADKAAREAAKLSQAYDGIVQKANQRITDLKNEQAALGMTAEQAARLRYETDLLHQAQSAGITLSAAQAAELRGLAATMASVEAEMARAKEQMDFAKGATNGFMSDLRSSLNQGKGFFESFGSAVGKVLDKILDRLQNDLVDALFSSFGKGPSAGGGGGIFGAIGSAFSSLFGGGRASGGPIDASKFYLVGEKGPELFAPGRSGTVIPNHALGGPAASSRASGQGVNVSLNVVNNGDPMDARIEERDDGNGGKSFDLILDQKMAETASRRGTRTNQALRHGMGGRSPLVSR